MNKALAAVMTTMLNRRIIGGKHAPEESIIAPKTRWLEKEDLRQFEREFQRCVSEQLILRQKKKTGKGSDWHICLNPRKLKEIYAKIGDDEDGSVL